MARARETCAGARLLWRRRRSLAATALPLPLRPTSRSSAHLGPDLHVDGGRGGASRSTSHRMCTVACTPPAPLVAAHPPRPAVPAGLPRADDGHLPPTIYLLLPTDCLLTNLQGFLERTMTKKNRKDFLSTVGPFLLVVTFLEDGKSC